MSDKVTCQICGKKLKRVHWTHLRIHNTTLEEYKNRFPNAKICSDSLLKKHIENFKKIRKNICVKGEKNPMFGRKHSEQTKEKMRLKAIKRSKHTSECKKEFHRKNPTWASKHFKRVQREFRERDPKRFFQLKKRASSFISKETQSRAGKIGSLKSIKTNRDNKPYYFMNVPFDSDMEREMCKMFVKYNIIDKPVEGVNVHFKSGRREIDFFPQQRIFIEFHPWDRKNTTEEYYEDRRKTLDENGFKHIPLMIIKKLDEFESRVLPLFGDGN